MIGAFFFWGFNGMTYSLRVPERRPGHRQASNTNPPTGNGSGGFYLGLKTNPLMAAHDWVLAVGLRLVVGLQNL